MIRIISLLILDPAALATMGYVQLQIQEHNTDTTAHADFTGATAEAAGERGMVPEPQAGDQDKFLTGGKTYVPVASQTEAEGMTDDKKPMTALKVKQLIDKLLGASNGIAGLDVAAKLQSILYDFATELEAQAGTNTTKPINAAGVAAAITALAGGAVIVDELLAQNGYVKFSNGLILQWGIINELSPNTPATVAFIVPFAQSNFGVFTANFDDWPTLNYPPACVTGARGATNTEVTIGNRHYAGSEEVGSVLWLAIGQ